jgi:hypothetical protein
VAVVQVLAMDIQQQLMQQAILVVAVAEVVLPMVELEQMVEMVVLE